MTPWLSDAEVMDLCAPLTQAAAQIRYLRDGLGLTVKAKPNGKPLVLRSHVEALLGGPDPERPAMGLPAPSPAARQPNAAGLLLAFHRK